MSFESLKSLFIVLKEILVSCLGNLLSKIIKTKSKIDNSFSVERNSDNFSIDPPSEVGKYLIRRKADVKELKKLFNKNHIVWICSIGGMGKKLLPWNMPKNIV